MDRKVDNTVGWCACRLKKLKQTHRRTLSLKPLLVLQQFRGARLATPSASLQLWQRCPSAHNHACWSRKSKALRARAGRQEARGTACRTCSPAVCECGTLVANYSIRRIRCVASVVCPPLLLPPPLSPRTRKRMEPHLLAAPLHRPPTRRGHHPASPAPAVFRRSTSTTFSARLQWTRVSCSRQGKGSERRSSINVARTKNHGKYMNLIRNNQSFSISKRRKYRCTVVQGDVVLPPGFSER